MKDTTIRAATAQDAKKLLEIYTPYVENTAITFEYKAPTLEEFTHRVGRTLERYPYLVAENKGDILGYSYAGPFKTRPAYDWSAETTIYIRQDQKKTGLGRRLYEALEHILVQQNFLNLYACIAFCETEDDYLTQDSVRFHERMGYRLVGEFYRCGYKFDRWYNMVWMEKHLAHHQIDPPAIRPYSGFPLNSRDIRPVQKRCSPAAWHNQ